MIDVRRATDADRAWIVEAARATLGSEYQVASHRQFTVTDVDALVAEDGGERAGFLAWEIDGEVCETLAIGAVTRRAGTGSALMAAVEAVAAEHGCRTLRVVTTDANTAAQRFYEHLGYRLAHRRIGAVDECRRLYKPTIPTDMHDELVYELAIERA